MGGRIGHVASLRFRGTAVVATALALQLVVPAVPEGWRFPVVVLTYVAVGAWLVVNLRWLPSTLRPGAGLLIFGWILNFAPLAANGGMPVSLEAAREVGAQPGVDVTRGNLSKHVALTGTTVLAPMADVIPIRPIGTVVSAGDIAMFAGMVLIVSQGMLLTAAEPRESEIVEPVTTRGHNQAETLATGRHTS